MGFSRRRRKAPHYVPQGVLDIQKYLHHCLDRYDVVQDKWIQEVRQCGGDFILYHKKDGSDKRKVIAPRAGRMRSERAETMMAEMRALVDSCSFSLDAEHLFEVKFPVETLAIMIKQHHVYEETGRVAVDCVRGGLYDLELAGYIRVAREGCPITGKNKANRIFLTPRFFEAIGVSKEKLCLKMSKLREYRRRSGKLAAVHAYDAMQYTRRMKHERVASTSRSDLIAALKCIKLAFTNLEAELVAKRKAKKEAALRNREAKLAQKKLAKANKQAAAVVSKLDKIAEAAVTPARSLMDIYNSLLPT